MAIIGLSDGGFSVIPEGTHVFKITKCEYREDFGKLIVTMETRAGLKHIERFSLLSSDGSPNQGALNAFSFFAKTAMNDFSLTAIDHTDLIGKFIECDVTHDEVPSNKDPGKMLTFSRLSDKRPSAGWADAAPKTTAAKSTGRPDLAALLG